MPVLSDSEWSASGHICRRVMRTKVTWNRIFWTRTELQEELSGTKHDIHVLSEKRRTQWYMRDTTTTACSGHVFPRPPVRWWGTKGKKRHAPTMFALGHLESLRLSIRGIGLTCNRKLCAEPSSRHLDAQHRRSRAEALSAGVPGLGSDGTIRRTTAESLQLTRRGQGTRNRCFAPQCNMPCPCLPEEAGPHTALSVQRD